jgi:hypothetical protein
MSAAAAAFVGSGHGGACPGDSTSAAWVLDTSKHSEIGGVAADYQGNPEEALTAVDGRVTA